VKKLPGERQELEWYKSRDEAVSGMLDWAGRLVLSGHKGRFSVAMRRHHGAGKGYMVVLIDKEAKPE